MQCNTMPALCFLLCDYMPCTVLLCFRCLRQARKDLEEALAKEREEQELEDSEN